MAQRFRSPRSSNSPGGDQDNLTQALLASVFFHLALVAGFTLKAVIYPSQPIVLERAIRVDMVGLPDKKRDLPPPVKSAPKETPPAPEPKEPVAKTEPIAKVEPQPTETKPPEPVKLPDKAAETKPAPNKVNLNQTKKAQSAALKRLEALAKIEKMAKENDKKPPGESNAGDVKPQPVRGNQVSPGSSLTGLEKIENEAYLSDLDEHVKKHWNLPNFLAKAKLSATVVIYVDETGKVIKKKMVRSSGNPIFDQSVMDSLEKASPFPPPPRKLANLFMVDGIQLGFPD